MKSAATFGLVLSLLLAACAAPTPEQRSVRMDEIFGADCVSAGHQRMTAEYQQCKLLAYQVKRRQALAVYNADMQKTGVGVLLLVH